MEVLILLSAGLSTVSNTLTLALNVENAPLVAKLALTNLHTALILVLVRELWRTDLYNDDVV